MVEACSATQERTEADHQNVDQVMVLGAIAPGIGQSATMGDQTVRRRGRRGKMRCCVRIYSKRYVVV